MSKPIGTLDIVENDKTYQVKIFHSVGYMGCNCMNCKLGQGIISFDFYKGMAMQKYLDLLHSEDPDENGLNKIEAMKQNYYKLKLYSIPFYN